MPRRAIATTSEKPTYRELIDYSRKWYNNRRLATLNCWILLLFLSSLTCGYVDGMGPDLQDLTQWELSFNHPVFNSIGKLKTLDVIQTIGALCAIPFVPYLVDVIGRRSSLFIGGLITCLAALIQTAANSLNTYIASRFLVGFGLTVSGIAAPMLITEISYPTYRATLTSLYNPLWYTGAIAANWARFGVANIPSSWAWRGLSVLQIIPPAIQVVLVFFAPESPRWLVSKGKHEQALDMLAYYHADGNAQDPLVRFEFEEIRAASELDNTVAANVGWRALFCTPGNRKRVRAIIALAFFSEWSGIGIISWFFPYISHVMRVFDDKNALLYLGCLQIWNFIWALIGALLVDVFGRRVIFLWGVRGMWVCLIIQTICTAFVIEHGNIHAGYTVLAKIYTFSAFYNVSFTPLPISYTLEILPNPLRAKGFTLFTFASLLANLFNQYVNPIALGKIGWHYYLLYVAWLIFEWISLYIVLIETMDRTLEESAALFDGKRSAAHISEQAANQANLGQGRHTLIA